jgi:hypothetical protein
MTRAVLVPVDSTPRWPDDPGFDAQAAEVVYKAMVAMDPDEALIFGRALVADSMQYDLLMNYTEIGKAYDAEVLRRATALRSHFSREAVAKARRGQDNTRELSYLVEIGKAWPWSAAAQHPRDEMGRFVQTHHAIQFDETINPMSEGHAKQEGIPKANLAGKTLSHYQQSYKQVRDLLHPYRNPDLNALVHMNVKPINGKERTELVGVKRSGAPEEFAHKLHDGDRIQSVAISVDPKHKSAASAAFDALSAVGAPRAGGYVSGAFDSGALSPSRLGRYNEDRVKEGGLPGNEPYSATTRAFGRMERGSKILQDSLGDYAPRQLTYALAVANHIGQFGPEAQKVIGPSADRMAYRYRGTERAPSARLQRDFDSIRNNPDFGSKAQRRQAALDGTTVKVGTREVWDPEAVLGYFRDHLPNPDLNELQRKSGVVPPSEGIILNRDGQIATQASGYADDWYLPFNLKNLKALKDGDYIRTRTFGGPTTEDIYTGLLSGARSLTVVSHSGVYNIQFDNTFRGGRRLNDKAARMVGRYGHLLDALRSNEVNRGDVSYSRQAEMHAEIANDPVRGEPEGTEGHAAAFKEAMQAERKNPVMSQEDRTAAALDWLGTAAARRKTADGHVMNGPEMVEDFIDVRAKEAYAAAKKQQMARGEPMRLTQEDVRNDIRGRILGQHAPGSGQFSEDVVRNIAEAMNMGSGFEAHMARAEQANRQRVRSLQLNGRGYFDGLQALKEQFPYYIHNVSYHEWRGTAGIGNADTQEGRRDTGYVAPRHNRSADVAAGYYNTAITGQGKVQASTTRFQNYAVAGGKTKPFPTRGAPEADEEVPTGVQRAATVAGAPTVARTVDPNEAAHQADLAMLHELHGQTNFAPNAKIGQTPIGGEAIRTPEAIENESWPAQHAAFAEFMKLPEPQLAEMLDHPQAGPALRKTMGDIAASGLLTVDPEVHQTFVSRGQVTPPTPVPGDVGQMLAELKQDHTFPGLAIDPTRAAPREMVEEAYGSDLGIGRLRAEHGLPPISDPDFKKSVKDITGRLGEQHADHVRIIDSGSSPHPRDVRELHEDTTSLLRATQLQRKWGKSLPAPKPDAPPEPIQVTGITNEVWIVNADGTRTLMDPAQAAKYGLGYQPPAIGP